jgi:rod shape-determining protein MreD
VNRGNEWLLIALSVVVALWLTVLPLPASLLWARPEWVALVVLYWVVMAPDKVGIGVAWLVGLLLDVIEGRPLGGNAFALAVVAYVTLILYQRLRMYGALQQIGLVFVLIGVHQLIGHWVQTLTAQVLPTLLFLLPALVSALLWPTLLWLLGHLRDHSSVS